MNATIEPSSLHGELWAPASKSSMQRACAAALLHKGVSIIRNPGHSNDDQAALGVIAALGAIIEKFDDGSLKITGRGVDPVADVVNCGEAGLGIRMFAPLTAMTNRGMTIQGEGSLLNRPMDFFDEVLPALGVSVSSNNGKLPLFLQGPLQPVDITIDGSLSSQFLTGLLMAYAAADAKDVTITVNNLKSRPYIDLTLAVLKEFGLKVPENKDYKAFYYAATPHEPSLHTPDYTVEGDWSGGAFLLVAGVIAGPFTVKGLSLQSTQADKAVLDALQAAGADIRQTAEGMVLTPGVLKAFSFDATDCPDLFPPLAALAAYCEGTSRIKGVERLTHKESNRALTLQDELGKMGVSILLDGDDMIIEGGQPISGALVHSRHDHRIAMACAVAALKADGPVEIEEALAVNKSYPDFYRHLQQLGAVVSFNNKESVHE